MEPEALDVVLLAVVVGLVAYLRCKAMQPDRPLLTTPMPVDKMAPPSLNAQGSRMTPPSVSAQNSKSSNACI